MMQILYPTAVVNHLQQFEIGPVVDGLVGAMEQLRSEHGPLIWCDKPDPFGIPVKNDGGAVIAYVVWKEA